MRPRPTTMFVRDAGSNAEPFCNREISNSPASATKRLPKTAPAGVSEAKKIL